jgi:hypothetical protein
LFIELGRDEGSPDALYASTSSSSISHASAVSIGKVYTPSAASTSTPASAPSTSPSSVADSACRSAGCSHSSRQPPKSAGWRRCAAYSAMHCVRAFCILASASNCCWHPSHGCSGACRM